MVVAEYFSNISRSHVGELSAQLKDKLDTMVEARRTRVRHRGRTLAAEGRDLSVDEAAGPGRCAQARPAGAQPGIAFNPGPEWAVDGEAAKSRLRLCFGPTTKEEIREGVAAFARVCYEETGIPE